MFEKEKKALTVKNYLRKTIKPFENQKNKEMQLQRNKLNQDIKELEVSIIDLYNEFLGRVKEKDTSIELVELIREKCLKYSTLITEKCSIDNPKLKRKNSEIKIATLIKYMEKNYNPEIDKIHNEVLNYQTEL